MSEDDDDSLSAGYWPSVSDLFISLFIVALAIIPAVLFVVLPKNSISSPDPVRIAVGKDLKFIVEPVNQLRQALQLPNLEYRSADQVIIGLRETCDQGAKRIAELEAKLTPVPGPLPLPEPSLNDLKRQVLDLQKKVAELNRQLNEKVIIVIEDRGQYRFTPGSAVITPEFAAGLYSDEFPKLLDEIEKRQGQVDTLEVIGHTDGVSLSGSGNLDQKLPDVLAGKSSAFTDLKAGSNNDLGLLRALAVRFEWEKFVADHSLSQDIAVRCYSAGQTVPPGDSVSSDASAFRRADQTARRIELRLTRLR